MSASSPDASTTQHTDPANGSPGSQSSGTPPTTEDTSTAKRRGEFDVVSVRRSDVRRLAKAAAPPDLPNEAGKPSNTDKPDRTSTLDRTATLNRTSTPGRTGTSGHSSRHGGEHDPRYRSRQARKNISFLIDLAIHLAGGAGAGYALHQLPRFAPYSAYAIPVAVAVFVSVSLVDRIFVQWAFRATLGKLLTGLCVIRDDTGGRPTLWSLVKDWLSNVAATIITLLPN